MTAHTPGPWQVHDYAVNFGPYNAGIDVGPGLRMVARVCGEFERPEPGPVAMANARLIAAAPDMLAALHKAHNFLDSHGNGWDEAETLEDARAAIAKAEGT